MQQWRHYQWCEEEAAPSFGPSLSCPTTGRRVGRDRFPGSNIPSLCDPPSDSAHHWTTFIAAVSLAKLSSFFLQRSCCHINFLQNVSAKSSVKMRVFLSMSLGQPCLCTAFATQCMGRSWLGRPTVALESGNDGLHFEQEDYCRRRRGCATSTSKGIVPAPRLSAEG